MVDVLLPSPLAPSHFPSGLQLAALAFRRAPMGKQSPEHDERDEEDVAENHPSVMAMLTKLEVTMARVPEASMRWGSARWNQVDP
jgi:hypothetical protein